MRMRKHYILILIISVWLATTALPAAALGPRAQQLHNAAVNRLHRLGDKMIDRRVARLQRAISRVNAAVRVAADDRQVLTDDLNTNINNLQALKAKIDADDNIDSLKSEIKSVVIDYRVFIVVLPRDHGKLIVGRARTILSKIDAVSAKLNHWLESARERGLDVEKLDSLNKDFQARVSDAHNQVDSAYNEFSAMQPAADVTEAKNHLAAGKAALRQARDDLKAARADLRKMIIEIKGLRLGTTSATKTAE